MCLLLDNSKECLEHTISKIRKSAQKNNNNKKRKCTYLNKRRHINYKHNNNSYGSAGYNDEYD
jgi:hypothetical protein